MQTFATHEERVNAKSIDVTPHALNNGRNNGKMTVFVRSKKVLVTTKMVNLSPGFNGLVPPSPSVAKRISIYENVLDQDQKAVLENSVTLARSLGVELEVKDVARIGVFNRFLDLIFRNKLPSKTPSVSFEGSVISLINSKPHLVEPRRDLKEQYEIPL
ncbi:MAG: hypothetical protein ACRECH_04510 [Nitrososphaerales archaeon]